MIRIAITVEAFEAIARTLPLVSVAYEAEADERGERLIWIEYAMADRHTAMRRLNETYVDVIMRLVETELLSRATARQ
jgi:hypothetical protein